MKISLLFLLAPLLCASLCPAQSLNDKRIEELTGLKGIWSEKENVFKVAAPREDLSVTAAGVHITPPMGLTSWAAFTPMADHVMVMGDLVLLEDQVNPVMSAALENGLSVTALHNHFAGETPRVMFMHIEGMGKEEDLAASIGKVFSKIRETGRGKGSTPKASIDPKNTSLDPDALDRILGTSGEMKDGVYKAVFGRTTEMDGQKVGNAMGVNTWAAFAGSRDEAVVDGDFAMLESKLQSVLKSLRAADINVVAIHNHMTGENPRIMFLHFWGIGSAARLAEGVRSALDRTAK